MAPLTSSRVNAGLRLVLLAQREPWGQQGRRLGSSPSPGQAPRLLGELLPCLLPAVAAAAGRLRQGPKTKSENISLSPQSHQN